MARWFLLGSILPESNVRNEFVFWARLISQKFNLGGFSYDKIIKLKEGLYSKV